MKRIFYSVLFIAVAFQAVSARTISADLFIKEHSKGQIANALPKASYYSVYAVSLQKTLSGSGHIELINFPGGNGQSLSLELKPTHSAIDASTECIVTSLQGDVHVTPPQLIAYKGIVGGEQHSRVFISVCNGSIIASIRREDGTTYVFAPEKNSSDPSAHMLIAETDLLATGPFKPFDCIADDVHQPHAPIPIYELLPHHEKNEILSAPLNNGKLLQTDIAVEADSQFYGAIGGDPSKTLAYIGAIFSMSSMIYEDEANLTHHLTWVKVWTTSDPYQVHGNAYALEDTVKSYWQLHYSTVQRDLAHIMTSIGYGGGGYGYYSLCDNANSYSVSSPQTGHTYPTFAFTYDVYIISHEIGHNFSLIHTHDCYWNPPLDTCYTKDDAKLSLADACFSKPITPRKSPGTIMSYCANTNYVLSGNDFSQYKLDMTFSPRPDSVMRFNAEKALCIQPPAGTEIILLSPRGGESYQGGSQIELKWTYTNVQLVTLDYSSDGGGTWNQLAVGLPASLAQFSWNMPNISSQKMLVKIYDPYRPATADTSILFFSLTKDAVSPLKNSEAIFTAVPNPAHDFVTVRSTEDTGPISCELINELGIICRSAKGNISVGSGMTMDTHSLASGKYFLHIKNPYGLDKTLPVIIEGK
jgi:hypothetical protein